MSLKKIKPHTSCAFKSISRTQTSPCITSIIQDFAHGYAKQRNIAKTINVFDKDRQKTEIDRMRSYFLTNDNVKTKFKLTARRLSFQNGKKLSSKYMAKKKTSTSLP